MGRVPALRAGSVFYWIRQEKRKRRDAIAKLEANTMYFYTETKRSMQMNVEDAHLPPLPISDFKNDDERKELHGEHHLQLGTETTHMMKNEEKEEIRDSASGAGLYEWYNNGNELQNDQGLEPTPAENNLLSQAERGGGDRVALCTAL